MASIEPGSGYRLTIPLGPDDHVQGDPSAPITLLEYGDYQCPYCGEAYGILKQVQWRLGRSLLFAFRNMPLTEVHPQSELAAEAAESAGARGKFWEMHDLLYENQEELESGLAGILRFGQRIALDVRGLEADLRAGKYRNRVRRDFMGGVRSGVAGTPTFFVNDERFDGDWSDADFFADQLLELSR